MPGPVRRTLFVKELGAAGSTLVFLPGVGGTTRYWEGRVAPLAASHRVVLVDLLGFGKSPKPWRRYTVERHVAELHRVLSGRGPFVLVGHSFGAIAALAYAARHPADVHGLVLLSLPYFGGFREAIDYFRSRRSADRWLMTNVVLAAVTCVITRRLLRRLLPRLLRDLPREVAEDLVQHTWLSSTSTLWDGVYRYDPASDAQALAPSLPVLLLHGDGDVTAPVGGARRLARDRSGWQVQVLSGVDHHPLLRLPEDCLEAIRSFEAVTAGVSRLMYREKSSSAPGSVYSPRSISSR